MTALKHPSVFVCVGVSFKELLREFAESNGNGLVPIVNSSQPNRSVEVGTTAEGPAEEPAKSDTKNPAASTEKAQSQGCGLSSVKDASRRAAAVFIVENPHNIDRHARTAFPTAFLFVNILYWLYYLFLWVLISSRLQNSRPTLKPSYLLVSQRLDLDMSDETFFFFFL